MYQTVYFNCAIAFADSMNDVIKITEGDYVLLSEEDVEKEIED